MHAPKILITKPWYNLSFNFEEKYVIINLVN